MPDVTIVLRERLSQAEKRKLFAPKPYALYEDGRFVMSYPSHKAAKRALHKRCMEIEKFPYDYASIGGYDIRPYKPAKT